MSGINEIVQRILALRERFAESRSVLVGLSGIDGSGKGYVAAQVKAHLTQQAVATAILNVDGWLNLPEKRFGKNESAENFYENAIRFGDFFSQLVLPLRETRSVNLVADVVEETAKHYRKEVFDYRNVSVILVEGIFLFKRKYRQLFDLAIWIDCSFSTALARAIERRQEGLPSAATIAAYEMIYFPAQRIHMERDRPRDSADVTINNDSNSFLEDYSSKARIRNGVHRRIHLDPFAVSVP